jgi:uncharacterized membrane protein YhaH (DUF805 family)
MFIIPTVRRLHDASAPAVRWAENHWFCQFFELFSTFLPVFAFFVVLLPQQVVGWLWGTVGVGVESTIKKPLSHLLFNV